MEPAGALLLGECRVVDPNQKIPSGRFSRDHEFYSVEGLFIKARRLEPFGRLSQFVEGYEVLLPGPVDRALGEVVVVTSISTDFALGMCVLVGELNLKFGRPLIRTRPKRDAGVAAGVVRQQLSS